LLVGLTENSFVMETLIDELATHARIDPIAYRLRLLNPDARTQRALLKPPYSDLPLVIADHDRPTVEAEG
jgi:hypothetical protein